MKPTFQELDVNRFNGAKIGGWYEKIMSEFTFIDSSITGSVRSLVKNIFLTIFSPLGSIKSPTLSQLPAKCKGANISSFLTISFKFIPIGMIDDIFLTIISENIHLSRSFYLDFHFFFLRFFSENESECGETYLFCLQNFVQKKVRKYVTSVDASKFEGRSISFTSVNNRPSYFSIIFHIYKSMNS